MPRPRKTYDEIILSGNSRHLSREELAARAAKEGVALVGARPGELERLDRLIAQTLEACARGQVLRGGKKNPAFGNLVLLMKARSLARQRGPAGPETSGELLARVDEMLKKSGEPN
jgi:hypothetical protein